MIKHKNELTAFGIWAFKDRSRNIKSEQSREIAKIDEKIVHCPFCKQQMKMWLEGCSLWHIICEKCDFYFIQKSGNKECYEKLVNRIYE